MLTTRVGPASVWCSGVPAGNVGDHVGDDPEVVARNRAGLAAFAGLPAPSQWVWLRQVHGADVVDTDRPTAPAAPPEADAAVTATRGLPLAVVTADCAPIVLASDDAVGVVHAGHRGLAAGVIEAAVARVRGHGVAEVRAFLGPCIRPASYEFGSADLAELVLQFGPGVEKCTAWGTRAFDLPAGVRIALARSDVEELDDCGVDTFGSPAYFSYRRDGTTGRQVTVAVLR
jgi:YfiH family protein